MFFFFKSALRITARGVRKFASLREGAHPERVFVYASAVAVIDVEVWLRGRGCVVIYEGLWLRGRGCVVNYRGLCFRVRGSSGLIRLAVWIFKSSYDIILAS